jgi:UDP-N-acetylglucosamine 2-epimerase (hydrolysing)
VLIFLAKIKSLISILRKTTKFETVFVTECICKEPYGYTLIEIERCNFKNLHTFENVPTSGHCKTIEGLSGYAKEINPELIVVHGDQ